MVRSNVNEECSPESSALGVILGSGLRDVCAGMPVEKSFRFEDIPGLSSGNVKGHTGEIRICEVGGAKCAFVLGRKHYYEAMGREIFTLMSFVKDLGVSSLLLTSAAGSLEHSIRPGEIVLIEGIIDLQFRKPSGNLGFNEIAGSGARNWEHSFADESALRSALTISGERAFDSALRSMKSKLAVSLKKAVGMAGISCKKAVLACMAGPAYETRAEVEALRTMGVNLATMSAAPEIACARHLGLETAAVAVVTNFATGLSPVPLDHEEVLGAGREAAADLGIIVRHLAAII